MTMCIAESIVHNGQLEPEDAADRSADWLDYGRGKGRTCVEACERLRRGFHWTEPGVESAGNGAAMRTASIGLFHRHDLRKLRRDAALACVITHTHPTAVASAVPQSAAVAYCLAHNAGSFCPERFIEFVILCIDGVEEHDVAERRPGGTRTSVTSPPEQAWTTTATVCLTNVTTARTSPTRSRRILTTTALATRAPPAAPAPVAPSACPFRQCWCCA
jgi:hypothetical protein